MNLTERSFHQSPSKAFSVKVRVEFAAAHHIRGYDGECARPHGHNWKIDVEARTKRLNQIGIAVDFKVLKALVKTLVERYDHQDLNTIEPFQDLNPTAETIAMLFYNELERMIAARPPLEHLQLMQVTVWENDRSAASFGLV